MSCAACQAAVEKAISSLDGVDSVAVSLLSSSAVVSLDEKTVTDDMIFSAVLNAGYSASTFVKREETDRRELDAYRASVRRLIVSAVFALAMMYVTMGHMLSLPLPSFMDPHGNGTEPLVYAAVQLFLTVPVIIINRSYFTDGFRAVISRSANMNTLVSLGASASLVYGIYVFARMIAGSSCGENVSPYSSELYFESVTMILTLITLGRTLEARARRHTSDAVRSLMSLAPKTAEILRDGKIITVQSEDIAVGDTVVIRAGSNVPCDGVVSSGGGAADESVITGESIPVPKEPGDTLICGTTLVSGYAEITAAKVGEDTTVAKIAELVENAASGKAPEQKLADKISGIFVPVVCSVAAVTFILWLIFTKDLYRAVSFGISVLVISCPCALGLATPTAVMCAVGRGASSGILIKSPDALDVLAKASVAVFDKTGTVTNGRMSVEHISPADGYGEKELLSLAASLEEKSEHPIGAAIVAKAENNGISLTEVTDFVQTAGGGVSGMADGKPVCGGNADFMEKHGVSLDEKTKELLDRYSGDGSTPVIFSLGGKTVGIISLSDKVKDTSADAVRELSALGLESVILTGDNEKTARAVAEKVGIKTVISGVKPDDKAANVKKIMSGVFHGDGKRRYVLMTGDGVNDAPALAQSDCGIAVACGTDIAMESAQVVLVKSDLSDVVRAVRLARASKKIIGENLAWAFGYNLICIPIAAGVLFPAFGIALTPMIASAAMSLSSVCVVTNALRLRRIKL